MLNNNQIPLYIQIKNDLIDKINNGYYQTEEKIPSENELKDIYDVSKITVRKAVYELVNEGYLYRLQGKGTYVAKRNINRMLNLMSFTEEMRAKNMKCVSRVLDIKTVVDRKIAASFEIDSMTKVHKVERLRLVDDMPVALQTSYLPESLISLDKLQDIYEVHSLYKILKESGIVPERAREKYNADILKDEYLLNLFELDHEISVFRVKRFTYTADDRLFEIAISVLRGDIYTMEVELNNRDVEQGE